MKNLLKWFPRWFLHWENRNKLPQKMEVPEEAPLVLLKEEVEVESAAASAEPVAARVESVLSDAETTSMEEEPAEMAEGPAEMAPVGYEEEEKASHEKDESYYVDLRFRNRRKDNVPKELLYIEELIRYRLGMEFYTSSPMTEPEMPPYGEWELPLGAFIIGYPEKNDGVELTPDETRLLLIALVHHVQPELFDKTIDEMLKGSADFAKIGGVRGKDYRGFMPTGETALFLLAGDDWRRRLAIQQLFWANHPFARKKILWLEDTASGEPQMSGKITMSRDYVEIFTQDRTAPPHFGISFPAKQVTTDREMKDLVIDAHLQSQLQDLRDWLEHHEELLKKGAQDGRFRRGYRALFYGPSGTGKTFAACLIGKESGKEVYRVDLSMVVSKYIGETEKNLELLFARAESKKWILFFDEADALFGKRTNVRDAHDKYANQEVSYLLQRIEDYDGLVILATNMKNNIDEAFIRRFNAILKFSAPEMEDRKKIWEKTFPTKVIYKEKLPGAEETALTKPFSIPEAVKPYELSGGNIVNIVHYAGIKGMKRQRELTPDIGEEAPLTIYLPDVLDGIRHELMKSGIPFTLKKPLAVK